MVCNPPKPLGFALGGQHPPTGIQALQRGIGLRVNPAHRRELKRHLRMLVNHQSLRCKAVIGGLEFVAIDRDRLQRQVHPLKLKRLGLRSQHRSQLHAAGDLNGIRPDHHIQSNGWNTTREGFVILQPDRRSRGGGGSHGQEYLQRSWRADSTAVEAPSQELVSPLSRRLEPIIWRPSLSSTLLQPWS